MKTRSKLARTLETERFILEPMGPIRFIVETGEIRRDPEILTGLFQSSKPRSAWKWARTISVPNNRTKFSFAITPKSGGGGSIGFHTVKMRGYRSAFNSVAIGDREWWGKGVVLEVRAKLMNHFFSESEIERFFGVVEARNTASIFNYRRLGYDHVGSWHRSKQNPQTGEVVDYLNFEIFKDKWMAGPWAEKNDDA